MCILNTLGVQQLKISMHHLIILFEILLLHEDSFFWSFICYWSQVSPQNYICTLFLHNNEIFFFNLQQLFKL